VFPKELTVNVLNMNRLLLISLTLCAFLFSDFSFGIEANRGKDGENDYFLINMTRGRVKQNEEDFRGALRIYTELYKTNAENLQLNYRMGECYVFIKEMDKAILHLEKVIANDTIDKKNAYFYIGEAYQYEGKIDDAKQAFLNFKSSLSEKQLEKHQVNDLFAQCLTAQELIAKPVNVKITNLGDNINSNFTDACPSVSADGKTLIFTSRRPENTGGLIEPSNDEYFDDIYISSWDNASKSWTKAIQIPGKINTNGHDANTSISPDGKKVFVYKNVTGVTKSGDIYVSTKEDDVNWAEPIPVDEKNVNSTYFESSACITADGNTMYFVSERLKDGYGNGDIYMAVKEGTAWGKPVNLGSIINTIEDEIGVFVHPDGKTLFFSSKGHNTMGGYDIFMSVFKNGSWSSPINMGYPVNTTKDEIHFVLSTDGKTAYLSSTRSEGKGKTDIYSVDMSKYYDENSKIDEQTTTVLSGPALSIIKGSVVDGETSEPIQVEIIIFDADENKEVTKITSNEKGEYFITLPAEKKYQFVVNQSKYKPLDIKFKLPKGVGETYTMTKHLILNKK